MLQGFPTDEHVQNICKPGTEETCRYLVMGTDPAGWECAKGTSIGRQLEEKGDSMNAQGDNCEGIIAELCDGRLIGKAVHHEETMPSFTLDGEVTKLEVSNGMLELSADWSDGEEHTLRISLGFLNVAERSGSIVISTTGPFGNTWTFKASAVMPMEKEGKTLSLPEDEQLVASLRLKLEEYRGRLSAYEAEHPEMEPAMQKYKMMDAVAKATILERLLDTKEIAFNDLSTEMMEELGGDRDPLAFRSMDAWNNAWGVISDYCKAGGANLSGGTGLRR